MLRFVLLILTVTLSSLLYAGAGAPGVTVVASDIALEHGLPGTPVLHGWNILVPLDSGPDTDGSLAIIDPATKTVNDYVTVGKSPKAIVSKGGYIYVANSQSHSVTMIAANSSRVIRTFEVGQGPEIMVVKDDFIYVVNSIGNSVSIINTKTYQIEKTLDVGKNPIDALLLGTTLFIANQGSDTLSLIDTLSNTVTGTRKVNKAPRKMHGKGYDDIYVVGADSIFCTSTLGGGGTSPSLANPKYVFGDKDYLYSFNNWTTFGLARLRKYDVKPVNFQSDRLIQMPVDNGYIYEENFYLFSQHHLFITQIKEEQYGQIVLKSPKEIVLSHNVKGVFANGSWMYLLSSEGLVSILDTNAKKILSTHDIQVTNADTPPVFAGECAYFSGQTKMQVFCPQFVNP